jgi:hypothetical protein
VRFIEVMPLEGNFDDVAFDLLVPTAEVMAHIESVGHADSDPTAPILPIPRARSSFPAHVARWALSAR